MLTRNSILSVLAVLLMAAPTFAADSAPNTPPADAVARAAAATAADAPGTSTSGLAWPAPGEARTIDEAEIDRLLKNHGKKLLVVNFWSTWCGPCVAEIPDFVEVSKQVQAEGVLFVGLSADMLADWTETVPPFLREYKVPYPNFVLKVDADALVEKFSPEWSGALPATFYYDGSGRKLGERLRALHKEELLKDIREALRKTVAETSAK